MITTIREGRRGCGLRRPGGLYLVSLPGGGILPLAVPVEPPVPYDGPHFRGAIYISLDTVLERAPSSEWLTGASAEAARKKTLAELELDEFGMTLAQRKKTGDGLHTLETLKLTIPATFGLGAHLRAASKLPLGKAAIEVPKAFAALQNQDLAAVLAAAWRLYNNCPPKTRHRVVHHCRAMAFSIGAFRDAGEMT